MTLTCHRIRSQDLSQKGHVSNQMGHPQDAEDRALDCSPELKDVLPLRNAGTRF